MNWGAYIWSATCLISQVVVCYWINFGPGVFDKSHALQRFQRKLRYFVPLRVECWHTSHQEQFKTLKPHQEGTPYMT